MGAFISLLLGGPRRAVHNLFPPEELPLETMYFYLTVLA